MTLSDYPLPWSQALTIYPFPQAVVGTSVFVLVAFFAVRKSQLLPTPKQLSWFITFLSSSTLTACSVIFLADLFRDPTNFERIWEVTPFGIFLSAFFLTTLVWDLILGAIFYPNYVDLVTGWIHHIAYIGMLILVTRLGLNQFYCLMCPMEAPTVLLSLGSMRKSLRRDWLFGTVFFLTRIVYHLYSIVTWYIYNDDWIPVLIVSAFFPMHLIWFRGFVKQQIRLHRDPEAGKNVREPLLDSFNGVSTSVEAKAREYGLKDRRGSQVGASTSE